MASRKTFGMLDWVFHTFQTLGWDLRKVSIFSTAIIVYSTHNSLTVLACMYVEKYSKGNKYRYIRRGFSHKSANDEQLTLLDLLANNSVLPTLFACRVVEKYKQCMSSKERRSAAAHVKRS